MGTTFRTGRTLTFTHLTALAPLTLLAAASAAQWTVTVLQPPGSTYHSYALGVADGQVVGEAYFGNPVSGIWNLTPPNSWATLTPIGWKAYGVSSGTQVGFTWDGLTRRACRWNGNPGSLVVLHPGLSIESIAFGTDGAQQVGYSQPSGSGYHACVWNGSSATVVDLHISDASESIAYGVSAGRQAGYVVFAGSVTHATLWSGTPASFVDLNPPPASSSKALAIHQNQQVGWAWTSNQVASLWQGTPTSWIDLGAGKYSSATAVYSGHQAGWVYGTGACVWSGSAASREDLPVPASGRWIVNSAVQTQATGIWTDGVTLYISGYGYDWDAGYYKALLWSRPLCPPDFNADGFVTGDDFDEYVLTFESGDLIADFDRDGFVTGDDFDAFVLAFEAGC